MLNPISFISKFIKSSNQRELDRISKIVVEINSIEEKIKNLKDTDFPQKTLKFKEEIEGVVCIAFTNDIPTTIKELELMSTEEGKGKIAIAYTLWSFKKGAGKKIMRELLKYMKDKNHFDSVMTLSPLTPMATHYHIRNGAKLVKINPTTQNFEYKI